MLTAAHVVRKLSIPENLMLPVNDLSAEMSKIISPGRLDLMKTTHSQLRLFNQGRVSKSALSRALTEADLVGDVQDCALGVDQEGYREDWALVNINEEFLGKNNQWWDMETLERLL